MHNSGQIYLPKTNGIRQNWTTSANFYISFCFDPYCQNLILQRRLDTSLCPHQILSFCYYFLIISFPRSQSYVVWQLVYKNYYTRYQFPFYLCGIKHPWKDQIDKISWPGLFVKSTFTM